MNTKGVLTNYENLYDLWRESGGCTEAISTELKEIFSRGTVPKGEEPVGLHSLVQDVKVRPKGLTANQIMMRAAQEAIKRWQDNNVVAVDTVQWY